MKRLLTVFVMILCLALLCALTQPASALTYHVDDEERSFVQAAESKFPLWRATDVTVTWHSSNAKYFRIVLMRVQDGMLLTRNVTATGDDLAGEHWEISDAAPIPLTDAGAAKAAAILDAFVLAPAYYRHAHSFLTENDLLSESARFLLNDGETLASLYPYDGYLVGIVQNSAGQDSLRLADWDGAAYGDVLATSMQECIWLNHIHSTSGNMEIWTATSEEYLERGEDGVWRLVFHQPGDDARYSLGLGWVVDSTLTEYDPYYSNDAWHYGTPTFPTTLPELVFSELPDLEGAIALLDASGWACVKTEGAALYDAPDGDVLASCFCRLPGRVLEQAEGWTQLLIGSEELGLAGWFRTEDLAFGAEMENVVCSFPRFDHSLLEDTAFAAEICEQLKDNFRSFTFWLIGKTPDDDWLMLIDGKLVRTVSPELVGPTEPTRHWWEDPELIGLGVFVCGDFQYILPRDGTAEITAYTGDAEDVVIPTSLDGRPVTRICNGAFGQCATLTTLAIPDSVVRIGTAAIPDHPSLSVIVNEGSYAEQYCAEHDLACVTISHSDKYWSGEWKNPLLPFGLGEYLSDEDIPPFDSDLDAVCVGRTVIDSLHEQGLFQSESLFLVAHRDGEDLWLFSYASQPLELGFTLCVVINGREGALVSSWLEE